ncbi:MAG: hypothetical protein JSU65_07980, partial [Candidatus Zixiibacteriota bacterium]
ETHQRKEKETIARLSFFDTLVSYFVSPRLNMRDRINQSYALNTGDYFKFDPSWFVLSHEATPMRTTVQPYGLAGDRLNVIHNGEAVSPFEHFPEPDGLMDMNDLPSALDGEVYLLTGPRGRLFGGGQSVATLLTRSKRPDDYRPETALLVDKGSFLYSFARGRYSKIFTGGREMDLSVAYRKADGLYYNHFEDSYDYYGSLYEPLSADYGMRVVGHLYDRDGRLAVRPSSPYGFGSLQARDRFDRSLRIGAVRHNRSHTARTEVGYAHLRQGSYLTQVYSADFNKWGHGGYIEHEFVRGNRMFAVSADADYLKYQYSPRNETATRWTASVDVTAVALTSPFRYGLQTSVEYVDGFRFLPSGTAVVYYESDRLYTSGSVGYSERAPALHELNLQYQSAPVYGASPTVYADEGNRYLITEKQLVGCLDIEYGADERSLGLRLTGGRIKDGIDWNRLQGDTVTFRPMNGDIDFATATGLAAYRLADIIRLNAGASYHWIDYERFETRAYTPEYQVFSGVEFHLFWSQKLIDLRAYGEAILVGPYDGYDTQGLGQDLVINGKLSFRMGGFRFHYIFHNLLSRVYYPREQFMNIGRYNSWGFTWEFLN